MSEVQLRFLSCWITQQKHKGIGLKAQQEGFLNVGRRAVAFLFCSYWMGCDKIHSNVWFSCSFTSAISRRLTWVTGGSDLRCCSVNAWGNTEFFINLQARDTVHLICFRLVPMLRWCDTVLLSQHYSDLLRLGGLFQQFRFVTSSWIVPVASNWPPVYSCAVWHKLRMPCVTSSAMGPGQHASGRCLWWLLCLCWGAWVFLDLFRIWEKIATSWQQWLQVNHGWKP